MLPRMRRRLVLDILYGYYEDDAEICAQMEALRLQPSQYVQWMVAIVTIDEPDRFISELSTSEQLITGHSIMYLFDKALHPAGILMLYSEMRKHHFSALLGIPPQAMSHGSARQTLEDAFDRSCSKLRKRSAPIP